VVWRPKPESNRLQEVLDKQKGASGPAPFTRISGRRNLPAASIAAPDPYPLDLPDILYREDC